MQTKKIIKLWLPVFLWMGVIFAFSCLPTIPTSFVIWWDVLIKKTAHVTEFAILFVLLYRAFFHSFKNKNIINWTVLLCFLYAFSDEFHQRFTPGRTSTLRDVFIDLAGILLGLYIVNKIKHKKERFSRLFKFMYGK
jgi:VanZ family protein